MENKNNNLGKFNKKAIYLNHGKYGFYLTYDKKNYKIPEWLPHEKIDLELASNYIDYKIKWDEKTKAENEGPKKDPLDGESE
jgi:hypothetical protein